MNLNKILAIVSLVLALVCLGGLGALALITNNITNVTTTTPPDKPVNTPNVDDVILPLGEDAGQEYLDKLYFVGDSTTYHFFKGGIDRSHILVPESLTLKLSSDILTLTVGDTGLTIPEAIKEAGAEIVIITIGVNGADSFTEAKYKSYYKKLLTAIMEQSPDTDIILQSVFPVTKEYSDRDIGITNAGIDQLNEWVKEIAFDLGLSYLDTQSILKNDVGAQIESYNEEDGVHMNATAYAKILEYIRTHPLVKE
jgi:lysophospholipase L1-like esterase